MRDIREGVGAAAIIFGIIAGVCIEFAFCLLSYLRLDTIEAASVPDDSARSGQPADEPKPR